MMSIRSMRWWWSSMRSRSMVIRWRCMMMEIRRCMMMVHRRRKHWRWRSSRWNKDGSRHHHISWLIYWLIDWLHYRLNHRLLRICLITLLGISLLRICCLRICGISSCALIHFYYFSFNRILLFTF